MNNYEHRSATSQTPNDGRQTIELEATLSVGHNADVPEHYFIEINQFQFQ